jgi:hypothetical protein
LDASGVGREWWADIQSDAPMAAVSNADFYSAAAQVLPLLFLAAAVEFRLLVVTKEDVKKTVESGGLGLAFVTTLIITTAYVATIGLGEWAALRVLLYERTFPTSETFVVGSLVAAGLVLALAPAYTLLEAIVEAVPDSRKWDRALWVVYSAHFLTVLAMPGYAVYALLASA